MIDFWLGTVYNTLWGLTLCIEAIIISVSDAKSVIHHQK